jgi:hypothetical protein
MPNVDDHGLEVLKKAARDLLTGGRAKNDYALQVWLMNSTGGGASASNIEARNASETISALKCLYSIDANNIARAQDNVSLLEASVFGVALTAANINESVQIQTSGTLRDTSFTWASGTYLYVGTDGALTDVAPTVGFRTLVATSQGIGQIFINIQ